MKKPPNAFAGLLTLTACCLVSKAPAQPTPPIPGNWTLTFQEEFSGTSLAYDKWRIGQHYAGNAGTGANTPGNVSVSSGSLRLKTMQAPGYFAGKTSNYTMSEVSTFKHFRQKYGYFEARIKYPGVEGLWPAFWLMPDRGQYGAQDNYRRAYLKFNLPSSVSSVSSATLRLTVNSIQAGGGENLLVMKVLDDSWTESGITWNNAPLPSPWWIGHKYNFAPSQGTVLDFDVKTYVTSQANGDKIVSFCLADTFMRDRLLTIYSGEHGTQSYRPKLIVNGTTYYPTADATIRAGGYASQNFGTSTLLEFKDSWGNTADTFNGGMEIDIMESLGMWGVNTTAHALHWNGYDSQHQSTGSGELTYAATGDGYHTYGLYWENGLVEFYVDGVKTWQWANSRVMSVPAYIILSHQLGGWGGNDVGSQVNNQTMHVDYVRAWSGTKTAGGGGVAGTKNIVNKHTGKALRPLGGGTADNVNIVQHTLSSSWASQKWDVVDVGGGYYKIQNVHTGKALRPYNAGTGNDVNIVQYTYSGWDTQKWQIPSAGSGYYHIINKYSGKALRPLGGGTGDDVNIVQHTLDPNWASQQWQLINNP